MATTAQRTHMHNLMDYFYEHRAHILYPPHDHRGSEDVRTFRMTEQEIHHVLNGGGYITADCSEMATEILRLSGCRDPNGLGYRYAGYTGTMLQHLPHYTNPADAAVGALVVYGPGTGVHVDTVYKPGKDPLLQGHGRPGIDRGHLSEFRKWHPGPVTFLSIAHL